MSLKLLISCALLLQLLAGCQAIAPPENLAAIETQVASLGEQISGGFAGQQQLLSETQTQQQAQLQELAGTLGQLRQDMAKTCPPTKTIPQKACPQTPVVMHGDRMVVGEIERVRIQPPGFVMIARIDTGAQSSSIHAENVTEFERDGKDWIRFDVMTDNVDVTVERKVEKYVRVYQQSDKKGTRRAVVKMRILIGNVKETFEFTLADRAHLEYGMILGRNFLTDLALVDVGRKFVQTLPKPQS